jgi:hypothetical protein
MPQTVPYTLLNTVAVPGLLADGQDDVIVKEYVAASAIPYGLGVELDATGRAVRLPLSTGQNLAQFAGISVYSPTDEPGGYAIGDVVRVLRRGRIAVTTTGAAVVSTDNQTAANINHSSTLAVDRGKFTKTAVSAGAGTEIGLFVNGQAVWTDPAATGIANLAWLEINLP